MAGGRQSLALQPLNGGLFVYLSSSSRWGVAGWALSCHNIYILRLLNETSLKSCHSTDFFSIAKLIIWESLYQ